MDELIEKIVEEELDSAKRKILAEIKRIFNSGNETLARRSIKLQFRDKISPIILTGEEIKGEGNIFIEVALVDDSTGRVVDTGPNASATVEIVLLKGAPGALEGDDWTLGEFNEHIFQDMRGKNPLLTGNVLLNLEGGIGVLKNVKFKHQASKMRPSVFRLGAKVVNSPDGYHVKEAKTGFFTVKDFRNKYYQKHEIPSLSDEVSRLVNIRKGGKIEKHLHSDNIYTVEHFLIRLLIDPEGLKRIFNLGAKKWDATVKNARACRIDNRMYCYINSEQKAGIVFDILGHVLELHPPHANLSENQKADAQDQLLDSAYKHWGNVTAFDDQNSLLQYLSSCLSKDTGPLDYLKPDNPLVVREKIETSEVIGEFSSGLNFTGTGVDAVFPSDGYDDALMQLSPWELEIQRLFGEF